MKTDSSKNNKSRQKITSFDGIKDIFNTMIVNMIDQVHLIEENISGPVINDVVTKLDKIDDKNEYFSKLLRAVLLKGIFLPINKHDLQKSIEKFESVIDLLQRVSHHLWLIDLPTWVSDYLKEMLKIIDHQLTGLNNWFTLAKENITVLDDISDLENKADRLHRKFLQRLFAEDLGFKVFTQAALLDQTLEDVVDNIEILSRQINIILHEYRTVNQPLPRYLP
jgi:uncharacterized protein Yka (UPF0111/DUF47 family)